MVLMFPTPVSQIPKVEKTKQSGNNCLWIQYQKKIEKVTVCPYHVSEQPKGNGKN